MRVDVSPAIGTGHLRRCLELGRRLHADGADIYLLVRGDLPAWARGESRFAAAVEPIAQDALERDDAAATLRYCARAGADRLVVDRFEVSESYERALHEAGLRWMQFDGAARVPMWADWVVSMSPAAARPAYEALRRREETQFLLGPAYAILREEFAAARRPPQLRPVARELLLTFGGGDDGGACLACLDALGGRLDLRMTILAGGLNPNVPQIEAWLRAHPKVEAVLLVDTPDVARRMAAADFAITAAGTTTFECAYLGVPSLLLQIAPNQRGNAEAWGRLGVAVDLGPLADMDGERLRRELEQLAHDPARRQAMADRGRAQVDGAGAARLARTLIGEHGPKTVQTLLVVGAGPDQLRAITVAKEMGYRVAAIDRNPHAAGAVVADAFAAVSTDDAEGALAFARTVGASGALTVISETGVPVVAHVAQALGLPGMTARTARLATNKNDMRRAFAGCGVPSVQSAPVRSPGEAAAFAARAGYPVVVKPSDASGQSGVSLVSAPDALEPALARALRESRDGAAVIEQFVPGPEVNVCALVHGGKAEILSMSWRRTLPPPHFGIAVQHVYPIDVAPRVRDAIEAAALGAIGAIGLDEGIAYPQLILGEDGPIVVEIAARIPGGYMCELASLASGIDMMRAAVLMATGSPFDLNALRTERTHAAVIVDFYTALSLAPGSARLECLEGIEDAAALPGVVKVEFQLRAGDAVPTLESSRSRFGAVVVVGDSLAAAQARLARARETIRIH